MLRESPATLTLMRRVAFGAVLLAFGVVVLGAYVRLTTAGLGCPDWPGCYGHLSPTGTACAVDVGKAWREMIHRYFAGSLVVLTLFLAVLAFKQRRTRARRRRQPAVCAGGGRDDFHTGAARAC